MANTEYISYILQALEPPLWGRWELKERIRSVAGDIEKAVAGPLPVDVAAAVERLEAEMLEAAEALEFERAALLRDRLAELRSGAPAPESPAVPAKAAGAARKGRKSRKKA